MRSSRFMGVIVVGACVALAGNAAAQVKGAGKSSITIVKVPAPNASTPTPKTAGSVSSKAQAAVAGKPPTGGGSFALKLAKEVGDPAKPGFGTGEYVLEIESASTATGDLVGDPLKAAYFIELSIDAAGKCTIRNHPTFNPGSGNCGGMAQPACGAAEALGKCSATIWQVAGDILQGAGLVANQPFNARFRIRTNPTPANCETGHLQIESVGLAPPSSTCRTGTVVGVAGVALGAQE